MPATLLICLYLGIGMLLYPAIKALSHERFRISTFIVVLIFWAPALTIMLIQIFLEFIKDHW